MRGEMREGGGREEGDEGEEGGEEGGTYSGGHRSSLFHSSWPLNVSLSEQPLRLFDQCQRGVHRIVFASSRSVFDFAFVKVR